MHSDGWSQTVAIRPIADNGPLRRYTARFFVLSKRCVPGQARPKLTSRGMCAMPPIIRYLPEPPGD